MKNTEDFLDNILNSKFDEEIDYSSVYFDEQVPLQNITYGKINSIGNEELTKLFTRNVFREYEIQDAHIIQSLFGNDEKIWKDYIEKRWKFVQTEVQKNVSLFRGKYQIKKSKNVKFLMDKWNFIERQLKKPQTKENMIVALKNVWKFSDVGGWYKGAVVDKDYHVCPTCLCPRFKGEMYDCCKGKFGYNESLIIDKDHKNQESLLFHDYTYGDQT